jgi:hypothetical protein
MDVDSQDRGARSCFAATGMQTHNLGFLRETTDKQGHTAWLGYGIESIADFAHNVAFLKHGGRLADLRGVFATGEDGLQVTRIACAAEDSLRTGRPAAC